MSHPSHQIIFFVTGSEQRPHPSSLVVGDDLLASRISLEVDGTSSVNVEFSAGSSRDISSAMTSRGSSSGDEDWNRLMRKPVSSMRVASDSAGDVAGTSIVKSLAMDFLRGKRGMIEALVDERLVEILS